MVVALTRYREKRDFEITPEPEGASSKRRPEKELFVVQKHQASQHLHYDFRLEWKGVLLSWAILRVRLSIQQVKAFMMPVWKIIPEYGGFEGVIPEGMAAAYIGDGLGSRY